MTPDLRKTDCDLGAAAAGGWKAHPFADMFPLMGEEELDALAADIKANGLRVPVVLYLGAVLDGRNRLAACDRAGIKPQFEDFVGTEEEALALVLSLNATRRNMTAGQRAIVAARTMKKMPERRGGDRSKQTARTGQFAPWSRDTLAKTFSVGKNAIQQALVLLDEAPDLAAQVETRKCTIDFAYKQLQARRKEAEATARNLERLAAYREALEAGEMTMEEAIKKYAEVERKREDNVRTRRQFFDELHKVLAFARNWSATMSDEWLAWFTEPNAPGSQTDLTAGEVQEIIDQVSRVRDITFAPREKVDGNGSHKAARTRRRNRGS
jgi:hypothetical protein